MIIKMTKNTPTADGYYFWRRNKFEKAEAGEVVDSLHFKAKSISASLAYIAFAYPDSLWSEKVEFEYS